MNQKKTKTIQSNFYRRKIINQSNYGLQNNRLEFKHYDVTLTKEPSALTKIKSSFKGENVQP